jgi:hypothetical protein
MKKTIAFIVFFYNADQVLHKSSLMRPLIYLTPKLDIAFKGVKIPDMVKNFSIKLFCIISDLILDDSIS